MYSGESFGQALHRGYQNMPSALRTIITANTVVFFIQLLGFGAFSDWMIASFGFSPDPWTTLTQPWRIFTYQFLHAGFFHLLFNMLWLWWMGRNVEATIGATNFWVIYLGAGIGGALISMIFSSFLGTTITIGASGSVFGIMVAFAMIFPSAPIMLFLLPPIEARFLVAGLIFLDVLFLGSRDNSARIVHLGGAAVGYLLFKYYQFGFDFGKIFSGFGSWFQSIKEKTTSKNADLSLVEDADIIDEVQQSELDRILDKISKKGYDGLTAEEKKILFELSKRN